MTAPTFDVHVKLTGRDGNAFGIIGAVSGAISREVGKAEADEFTAKAFDCDSYDSLLRLASRTVHVS